MNFSQQPKLSKAEWNSVEEPVSEDEQKILKMIIDGYNNVNVKHNHNISLLDYSKIEKSDLIENFIYVKFFKSIVLETQKLRNLPESLKQFSIKEEPVKKIKKMDVIRIENVSARITENMANLIEFIFLDLTHNMMKYFCEKNSKFGLYYYTLTHLRGISVTNINTHVFEFIDMAVAHVGENMSLTNVVSNACEFIEQNENIYKYGDITLYDHQKRLFTVLQRPVDHRDKRSNLVLYIAPTGTGKTLSPIGLSNSYRVIYVCAARHVGIALAKSAISVHKCVAFAFGCETAADIRLHNYSAQVFKVNKRSGGIGKIDNAFGQKVEIMICDVKSYLIAMYYMMAFNERTNLLTYWDEPTIGMDDENADNVLHEITHRNWSENKIPNMVLSSATLPTTDELAPVINDFRSKFNNVIVTEINSHDCKKSITLLNKMGYCVCPHLLHEEYAKMIECVQYCHENKTLLRYFDLAEVTRMINHLSRTDLIPEDYLVDAYFDGSITNIRINSIKVYYLDLLRQIPEDKWPFIYKSMKESLRRCLPGEKKLMPADIKKSSSIETVSSSRFGSLNNGSALSRTKSVFDTLKKTPLELAKEKSLASGGILLTTVDAHTLTDGPTIYLTEDVDKIGNFYIQQSNISKDTLDEIMSKIWHNNAIIEEISKLNDELEDMIKSEESVKIDSKKDTRKESRMTETDEMLFVKSKRTEDKINGLKANMKYVSFDTNYIPNTVGHQTIRVSEDKAKMVDNAFAPNIDQSTVQEIMGLEIADGLKVMVLLGIGIFSETTNNSAYNEIVKRLANNKQLFMIIASSDYIYGTNYQFCHGFIGKDLLKMTQQKTIQAMGRIGRNNIQQEYSVRFRDDDIIANLFCPNANNVEAQNMCRILQTDEDDE
jgi:hypothetical protein